jgi:hypothetical protein
MYIVHVLGAVDTKLLFLCTVDILNTSDVEDGAADPTHWVNLGIKVSAFIGQ